MSASTYAHAKLRPCSLLGTTSAVVLAQHAGQKTTVRLIILHNTGDNDAVVALHMPEPSNNAPGAAALANRFQKITLESGATIELDYPGQGLQLDVQGDSVQAQADTAGVVTAQVHGGRE